MVVVGGADNADGLVIDAGATAVALETGAAATAAVLEVGLVQIRNSPSTNCESPSMLFSVSQTKFGSPTKPTSVTNT